MDILAIIISLFSYNKSKQSLDIQIKHHDENKTDYLIKESWEKSEYYVDVFYDEYLKLKDTLGNLSELCISTNNNIGMLFENCENILAIDIKKARRHIYNDTYELIVKSLESQFDQKPQVFYPKLTYFRDFWVNNRCIKHNNEILENINILTKSIDIKLHQQFYNDFLLEVNDLVNYLKSNSSHVKTSLKKLENALQKNNLDKFNLKDNIKLYNVYSQLLSFLRLIDKTPIQSLLNYDKSPYLPIGKIICIGANIDIFIELSNKLNCSLSYR